MFLVQTVLISTFFASDNPHTDQHQQLAPRLLSQERAGEALRQASAGRYKRAKERVLKVSARRSAFVSSIQWNILSLIRLLWYHRFLLATIAESGSEQPHSSLSALGRNSH